MSGCQVDRLLLLVLGQVKKLSGARGRRLDREHVTHGHAVLSPHGAGADHHVERAEAGRRLVLMAHNGSHVAPRVSPQHQLLL